MAELATIARPYAEALFDSAKADAGATLQWLEALAAVAGNAQLQQFAGNPKVGDEQVYSLVTDVARVQLPAAGQNFLRTVIANGRLAALPDIAAQFQALVNARVERLVFGARDPKAGFCGSLGNLVQDARLNHRLNVEGGFMEERSRQMLQEFFRKLRERDRTERWQSG